MFDFMSVIVSFIQIPFMTYVIASFSVVGVVRLVKLFIYGRSDSVL